MWYSHHTNLRTWNIITKQLPNTCISHMNSNTALICSSSAFHWQNQAFDLLRDDYDSEMARAFHDQPWKLGKHKQIWPNRVWRSPNKDLMLFIADHNQLRWWFVAGGSSWWFSHQFNDLPSQMGFFCWGLSINRYPTRSPYFWVIGNQEYCCVFGGWLAASMAASLLLLACLLVISLSLLGMFLVFLLVLLPCLLLNAITFIIFPPLFLNKPIQISSFDIPYLSISLSSRDIPSCLFTYCCWRWFLKP